MKFFTLIPFLLLAVYKCNGRRDSNFLPKPILPTIALEKNVQVMQNQLLQQNYRRKRQTGIFDSFSCMSKCMQAMLYDLRNLGLDEHSNGAMLNMQLLETDVFEQYCDISETAKSCLRRCNIPLTIKNGIDMAFSVPDYICEEHYDEFRRFLPCYKAADSELESRCNPRCGDPKKFIERSQTEIRQSVRNYNVLGLQDLMQQQCKMLRCTAKCYTPIIKKECKSERAASLLNDMMLQTLRKVQEMLYSVPGGRAFWPSTCQRIADEGFPTLTNQIPQHSGLNNQVDFTEE